MKRNFILSFIFLTIVPFLSNAYEQNGIASWYGPKFNGKMTANGEIFNTNDYTAAHRSLPFDSVIKVTSIDNGKSVYVRITDRGPFAKDRILDVSNIAAKKLGMIKKGTANIHLELISEGSGKYYRPNGKKYNIIIATYKEEKNCDAFMEKLKANGVYATKQVGKNNGTFRLILKNLSYEKMQFNRIRINNAGWHSYKVETIK